MTKDNGEQFYAMTCRGYTLPREMMDHHNLKDGSREAQMLDPYWKSRTSCLYGNHGVEIRIWSLSEDNTQSWVRISHGSNKFVMDSNNTDT